MFYLIMKHLHSTMRWIVIIMVLYNLFMATKKLMTNQKFSKGDGIRNMLATYAAHIQLTMGLILYFVSGKVIFSFSSMKNPLLRFFLVEHLIGMLIAVTLITVGYSQAKKAKMDRTKNARIFLFNMGAIIVILLSIPWPWNQLGAGWY
jgi:hypothetical protein